MANVTYISKQGDTVSLICFAQYGATKGGVVEAVLEANVGLASYGARLPANVKITLPDLSQETADASTINLWD